MGTIAILDQNTIDKIAAGEVVERPASVVKELVENAIDAGSTAVTVEIRDGGISFIRITDNGSGIPADQVPLAFLRHATSKLRSVEELVQIASLGFRGEALSSIAAVSQVEMITKTPEALTGVRYVIEGGVEKSLEEVGAPSGTTFLVRNLFYNTPARQKFLRTAVTEANAVTSVVEQLALSHPEVSFKYMVNAQTKLHTSGNRNLKELVFHIYGREVARELIEIHSESPLMTVEGFIGKPVVSRGNRNFENYYVNGRYVRSKLLAKAIEDGYHTSIMQHKYPFTLLYLHMNGEAVDVNVHPTKMELRFSCQEEIYHQIVEMISAGLQKREQIVSVSLEPKNREEKAVVQQKVPEPFEQKRQQQEGYVRRPLPVQPEPSSRRMPVFPERESKDLRERYRYGERPVQDGATLTREEEALFETGAERNAADPKLIEKEKPAAVKAMGREESAPVSSAEEKESPAAKATGQEKVTVAKANEPENSVAAKANEPEKPAAAKVNDQETSAEVKGMELEIPAASKAMEQREVSASSAAEAERTPDERPMEQQKTAAEQPGKAEEPLQKAACAEEKPGLQMGQRMAGDGQMELFDDIFLSKEARKSHRIIGQVFDTYWLVQYEDSLYIIDQHAAHEKVLFERMMKNFREKEILSQIVSPPLVVTLTPKEADLVERFGGVFASFGYEITGFGGNDYALSAVPHNLYGIATGELFLEILDNLEDAGEKPLEILTSRLAVMSCKAAVKGNRQLSREEMEQLIGELLTLDDPYHCPHGRPTIISLTKRELEKKFKRIV